MTQAKDIFKNDIEVDAPGRHAFSITPHDSNELSSYTRGIYVGSTGDIVVTMVSGNDATFTNVPAGYILPVQAKLVKSTGTTATGLVGIC